MKALAVMFEAPERIEVRSLGLMSPGPTDLVVEIGWSGISSGTEKLLWSGRMPSFPGMGYPLVPGYESIGEVVDAGAEVRDRIGEWVFVPGATCWEGARSLFGGTARRLVLPAARAMPLPRALAEDGVLLALAATARHALAGGAAPELVIGHGVLGRLIARIAVATGAPAPVIWESNPARRGAALDQVSDDRRDYRSIYDASGDPAILDTAIGRLARGGEIVLAGFYDRPLAFAFPPAFMREARIRVAAEFTPEDMMAVLAMVEDGRLRLDGLVNRVRPALDAAAAYAEAFGDPDCLKMVLDWREAA